MGDHHLPDTGRRPEPVLTLDLMKAGVAVAVGYGWVTVDDPLLPLIITAGGGLLTLVLTAITRRRVTPAKDPVDRAGNRLAPATLPARPPRRQAAAR